MTEDLTETPDVNRHHSQPGRPSPRPRRGFTAVEFLIVVAIIFLLLSLLLPAIQQAQSAARSSQCRNNLKQVALALHNYHDAHRTLPPGYVSIMGLEGEALRNEWAWGAFLLPYLDQAPLFQQLDYSTSVRNMTSELSGRIPMNSNQSLADTWLTMYLCPLDQQAYQNAEWDGFPQFGPTSYSAIVGIDWQELPCATLGKEDQLRGRAFSGTPCVPATGAFFLNSRVRYQDVRDGFSNTIVLGEVSSRLDRVDRFRPDLQQPNLIGKQGGSYWANVGEAIRQEHVLTASSEGINAADENGFSPGLNSYHLGGAHAAFLDGSVRFVSDMIDSSAMAPYGVLQRLSTIAGNDVISDF